MKRWKYILLSNFVIIIIVFSNCQNHPVSVSAYSDSYSHNKETKIISLLKNIDIMLDETGGYLDIEHPDSFIATSHLIFTLSMLEEIDQLTGDDREYVLLKTRNLVQFIRENFIDPFHHDSRGITNFFNINLEEESYSRAIKKTSDQILFITVLSRLIEVLNPDDSSLTDYGILINQTIDFVKEYLDDTEFFGYYRKVTPIGQDSYVVDKTKSIEDLSWIILSMISLPDEYYNKLDPSGQKLTQLVDFINSNIQEEDGAITSFLSNDGSYKYNMYSLRDNALYALANMAIYKETNNITNLSTATRIFNFLRINFWDLGFQGYFEQVDDNRDISVRCKSASGNILVTQLLYELLTVYPNNKTYSDTYSKLKTFIQDNFEEYTGLVNTSINRRGVTVIGKSFKSNTINYWSLISQPHITDIQFNKEIPIGLNFEGRLTISNPYNQTFSLILESEAFSEEVLISEESIKVSLPLNSNVSTGVHFVFLALTFQNTEISKYEFAITISTGAITLPILLILGFGTMMIIILFLMRPELLNILVSETKRELEENEELKMKVKSEKAVNTEKNLNR